MNKELSARDIVSSIICAANRKMMKGKGRKAASSDEPADLAAENKRVSVGPAVIRFISIETNANVFNVFK